MTTPRRAWIPLASSVLLVGAVLTGSFATATPAHAAPDPCSAEIGQLIDDPVAFNLAVAEVNNTGDCNVIDVAAGFTFTTAPAIINPHADVVALTLTGPTAGATLDGNAASGILIDILNTADFALVVRDLAFQHFDDTGSGLQGHAALEVHAAGALTANLTDVTFLNNAAAAAGGLFFHSAAALDVALTGTVTFTNNVATSALASVGAGALRVGNATSDSSLTLGTEGGSDAINFVGNTSVVHSGGIQADNVTIWGGDFTSNSTTTSGGAISGRAVNLTGVDCTLNSAAGDGGGAVNALGDVTVHGGTFDDNTATGGSGDGGAIRTVGSVTVDQGASFTDNTAGRDGGAIKAGGDATIEGSSSFLGNLADNGAALDVNGDVTIDTSSFEDNGALLDGGAVRSRLSSITSADSQYLDNTAGHHGGALVAGNGLVSTTDDSFLRNTATTYHGGAILAQSTSSDGATFTDNVAGDHGGAVRTMSITDSGSDFTGNAAGGQGGSVAVFGTTIPSTVTDTTFRDGAALQGAAIFAVGGLTLTRSNFEDNVATITGGAVEAQDSLVIDESTFFHNDAGNVGGAVFASKLTGSVMISDTSFSRNQSGSAGGALFTRAGVTSTDSEFTLNSADEEGGAIFAVGDVNLDTDTLTDNSTPLQGGAIYTAASAHVTDSTLADNSSQDNGGAIRSESSVDITDSTLSTNTSANYGGAVFATNDVTVDGSVFSGNIATARGGAIHGEDSATITQSTFTGNTVGPSGWGGALSVIDHLTLTHSTLRDGGGASLGGGFSAGTATVSSSSIIANQATNGGGGFIALRGDIVNSTFWGNQSAIGGALMFNFDDPNPSRIILSTLAGNTANASQGSAIASPPNVTIQLIGSVLAGADPVCSDDIGPAHLPLNLAPDAAYSFATDDSCGTGPGIDTSSSTLAALGLAGALTTDSASGMQVDLPTNASVLNTSVPLAALASLPGPLKDQLGALRNSPNGLTSAGSVQVRPLSISGPSSSSVVAGDSAAFTVAATPGLGPTLAYQWQRSLGGAPWTDITGNASAQTANLVLPSVSLAESGLLLRVRVSDMRNTGISGTATLTVIDPSPPTPPSAPLGVRATAGASRAVVTWQAPSSTGSAPVTSYEVRNDVDSQVCVVAASAKLECTMTGFSPGRAYRFSVRARNAVDWGLWSQWSTAVTPEPVGVTITIRGTRKGNEVIVIGSTTGLEGKRVRAMVRFGGERDYTRGSLRPIREDGGFTWKLTTRKAVHIYFTHADVRSKAVVIPARPRR